MDDKENGFIQDTSFVALKTISGISFTPREVDIMACLLSRRGTSKIASILSISGKTVGNHVHNIIMKVGCSSRDGIVDFIEKSDKMAALRKHYLNLLTEWAFHKSIKDILKLNREKNSFYRIIHWPSQGDKDTFIPRLESHLKLTGLNVSIEPREKHQLISQLIHETPNESYLIYVLPSRLEEGSQSDVFLKKIKIPPPSHNQSSSRLFLLPRTEMMGRLPTNFYVLIS